MDRQSLAGVYVAALTPLKQDLIPDLDSIPRLLKFYADRGCHGALLLGTTGEGPSFSYTERISIYEVGLQVREEYPHFRLLAGTGTPSLTDTIQLSKGAFDLGYDGVVVLPPYYFRTASEDGLYAWYDQVLRAAVPSGGSLLGYHIPATSGVPLQIDLLKRLKDAYPDKFAGLKDSSGDPRHAEQLGEQFGDELCVLNGNDRLFGMALAHGASGCITALANVASPELRCVWEAHHNGDDFQDSQAKLAAARVVLDEFQPAAPTFKALLAARFGFPAWMVRPPLLPLPADRVRKAKEAFDTVGLSAW